METTFKINNIISISLNEYLDNPDLVITQPPSRYHAAIEQAIVNKDAIEFDLCKRDFSEAFIRELVGDYLTKHGMNVIWTINFINSNNNMRILIDEILTPQLNKFWESVGNLSDDEND